MKTSMHSKVRLAATLSAAIAISASTPAAAQVTRGEVADRNAAYETSRCARGYIQRNTSGVAEHELWLMCLQASSELAGRNPNNVAQHVVRQERRNVFQPK